MNKIEELKEVVENKFGEKITNLRTSKKLSEVIYFKTKKTLSYNTIRRLFNVSKTNQITYRESTLDILSKFCNFYDFQIFKGAKDPFTEWNYFNKTLYLINEKKFKKAVNSFKTNNKIDFNLLAIITNAIIKEKKYSLLIELFNSLKNDNTEKDFSKNDFIIKTKFSNQIANSFKSIKKNNPILIKLANCPNFIKIFIHFFIDYSKNNNHITVLRETNNSNHNYTDTCFKELYLFNYNYLSNNEKKNKILNKIDYNRISNDFVKGRYIAYLYLINNFKFQKFFKNSKLDSITLATEILPLSIYCRDIYLLKKIINHYKKRNRNLVDWFYFNEWLAFDILYSM